MTKKLTVYDKTKRLLEENKSEVLRAMMEHPFWPRALELQKPYTRLGDDTSGEISVVFASDADAWVEVWSDPDPEEPGFAHRFRCGFGGGDSLRVRNALLMLALAIKLDNEAFPQDHRRKIKDPR